MNRKRAKMMTATGFSICAISLLFVFATVNFGQILSSLLLVGGIVLIFLSLAYYTEK